MACQILLTGTLYLSLNLINHCDHFMNKIHMYRKKLLCAMFSLVFISGKFNKHAICICYKAI